MKVRIFFFFLSITLLFAISACKKHVGCNDPMACNFDPEAVKNDNSCTYGETWYQDADGDGLGNPLVSINTCDNPIVPDGYVLDHSDSNDVPLTKKQRTTVVYVGATWCMPCGSYGSPCKSYMETTHGDNVVIISVQFNDSISTPGEFGPQFGGAFQNFVGAPPIPHGYWSGNSFGMAHRSFGPNANINNSAADYDINSINANAPEVGIGATASISGNIITIKTKTVFYNTINAPRFIGVYLLEDGISATQQMVGAPPQKTIHNNVLRVPASGATPPLGLISLGNNFIANQEISGNYTIAVNNSWNPSRFQVAVVIWKGTTPNTISNSVLVNVY